MVATPALEVLIVSDHPGTLDGLQDYFQSVGVPCRFTRRIEDLALLSRRIPTSAVIFPDDFGDVDLSAWMVRLQRSHPRSRALLVTRVPHHFRDIARPMASERTILVVPRPSLGWEILDAILGHAETLRLAS